MKEARATVVLAVPIIIGQLSQVLMGFTDTVMIGRIGTVPLAASSFGSSIFNVLFIIGIGLLVPVSVFASRSRGAGRHDEAGEYLRHGFLIALVTSLVECALIVAMSRHLGVFGQPPEVVASVNPFFLLIGASLLPVFMYSAQRQFAESMGRPWVPTAISVASVLLNVGLNWILIYGHFGFPALGLTGSGIATLSARVMSCCVIFLWLRSDKLMHAAWPRRWLAPFSAERTWRMMHVGMPAAGCLLFEIGAFAAATVMMGWLGAVPLAAHQVAISCASLTFMVALGLAIAIGMRASAAVGAGEHGRLRAIWAGGAGIAASMSVMAAVIFLFWGSWVSSFFIADPGVIAVSTRLLAIGAVFQLFDGNQVINSSALRGMTDVRIPALLTFVAYWIVAVPLAYLLGIRMGFGPSGIWTGLALGLAVAAILLGLRFLRLTRPAA
ncbi:MAG TPA: MATE family efflux transporter [Opitutaceae bacterium]|nr:MATE family efflux transporter [Opitutaceae bacterium]